ATANSAKSLNIYKADAQCNGLVPQKVEMPGPVDANAAVGQVIANSNSPDFRVVNYRVQVENGTATVDLRLPTDAKRPFSALSACEQLEFFGSMEKTLTGNPSLQVRAVRFRDGQKELQF
ncbi:MAG: sporulation/spore germination protein, partial [Alkalinema sp. RU_4_3]|nr:sporulation/spore germination protein [Alkalinema sp. RU_4_3]